ncbi:hypothetical protein BD560DRAFT_346125 [Blakeslea trispora]|nr:hypothetical protein BD560DRAFT_346125 [Blakeslea trispora]
MKEKLKEVTISLHWACITGNVGLVKFALDHGVPVDSTINGFVPLQLSCISDNNIAVTQYLIDRGADVNIQKWPKKHSADKTQAVHGATGSTALHVACANGCTKTVDLLIRNNAFVDVKDKYGSTPLDIAQAKSEPDIVKMLTAAKDKHKRRKLQDVMGNRKSLDLPKKTHRRTTSEKLIRVRRPSMPSIFEKQSNSENLNSLPPPSSSSPPPLLAPAFISMTPTTSPEPISRRSFTSTHRPLSEEMHSIHISAVTPKSSSEQFASNDKKQHRHRHKRERLAYSSEDFHLSSTFGSSMNRGILSDCSSSIITIDSHPDWYGYGIVRPYHEDNYLQSLERRAFKLDLNEGSDLSKMTEHIYSSNECLTNDLQTGSKKESPKKTFSSGESVSDLEDGYDSGDDEEEINEPNNTTSLSQTPAFRIEKEMGPVECRPKKAPPIELTTHTEAKKGWLSGFNPYSHDHRFSLDIRSNLDNFSHLKRKNHYIKQAYDFSSDEDEKSFYQPPTQQRPGFFSRWTSSWPRK